MTQRTAASSKGRFSSSRKSISVSSEALVRVAPLLDGTRAVSCTPTVAGLDAREWLSSSGNTLARLRDEHGAVLLRGFTPLDADGLGELATGLAGELRDYNNRSTPRQRVNGRVFTSTEYPPDQTIPQHNEMSYTDSWPGTLFLACMVPAPVGGETPLADSARVYARVPASTRERFERHGVMYVRNFGHGMDLSWQEVFQTQDRDEVAAYCEKHGIQAQWLGGERLRTRHVVQAALESRATGEKVWFNQAHLFHVSSLPESVERELRESFSEDELPRNAMYGDGSPLDPDDLAQIRAAYAAEEISLPWQEGDVVIVDNEQFAHGRKPYSGARSVLVAMA
ncbi:TauD/TfdA family dioxygenase [Streptomyces lunaelactis]|uniref:TauD/TfdA family dioxygenase n=1 Tax=Streptomyces lunaelactis TaxID=1535768 RepID=UPI0015850783|nr:TauD/TfdA family dioxygenase [Streptomyces lunaelactis]NUK07176.1 TauD/TfdA family dioxygenase [Streptomyces lunaelactis]NUK55994.1 TauD/TfdA family dioxygenase [Streptomyces lunaelactis]NUL09526.1 TauD/TfdA family dioxygenase [Streptomyces lunaelactis]NUL22046.1 TauD/TfdA family dioxygenase [Streptomyces lunaelactis]